MTATIREANVFSDMFILLYSKISTITDPGSKNKWVYGAFPEKLIDNKAAYPLIVITSADVSYAPLTLKNLKRGPVRFGVDVYSTSAEQLDSVSSSVANKMESEEGNFQASGISVIRLTSSVPEQFSREKFRIHNRSFNYEFDFGWF